MVDGYRNQAPEKLQVNSKTQISDYPKPRPFNVFPSHSCLYPDFTKQGKYQAMVVCCILGIGGLVSWNSMLTIADYYYQVFPVRLIPILKFVFFFVLVIE